MMTKLAGIAVGLAFTALGAFGSYWLWPSGILSIPFSALTLGMLLQAIGSVALGFFSIFGVGAAFAAFDD